MAIRISPDEKKALAERLQREASASRPAFSEALHERICDALKQPQLRPALPRAGAWWQAPWISAAAAAAAVCVVGVTLAVFFANRPPATEPTPIVVEAPKPDPEPTVDPIKELGVVTAPPRDAVVGMGSMLVMNTTTGEYAKLKHDAGVAKRMLIDSLPFDLAPNDEP